MKNKIKIFYICLCFFFFNTNIYSLEKFYYEADDLKILDNGNILESDNSIKIIINENIEITSNNFRYNQKRGLVELNGNIEINDKQNGIIINTNQVFYLKKENKIFSRTATNFKLNDAYFAETLSFNYLVDELNITSDKEVKIYDNSGNTFFVNEFKYQIKKQSFNGSNTKFIDKEKNEYLISESLVDLKKQNILGKDLSIIFNKSSFDNNQNDPRLKANTFYSKDNISSMNKGVFTTCKKDDECPPWQIYADNIVHDKNKKTINYKNAWLKIYDTPVVYFPRFSHPDPTVKRQSGFLTPDFTNSSVHGLALSIPYYMAISENKDLTFTPRLYDDGQNVVQTEYRQVNKNSKHIVDLGINSSKLLFFGSQTKSHFFSNSIFDIDINGFNTSNFELNLEKTTNDLYLKTYKINSPLIDNYSLLHSYLDFNAENDNLSFSTSVEVYNDLSQPNSDKYEYVYPNYNIIKKIELVDDSLSFSSYGFQKKYQTNKYEGVITNDLLYEDDTSISSWGLKKNFKILLKNVNADSLNSTRHKDGFDQSLLTSILFSGEYPLKRNPKDYEEKITPKFSIMYSPNKSKNMANDSKRVDINNIYSFNRIGVTDTVEGGASITLGTEYKKTKTKNYTDFIDFNIATIIRADENEDLASTSTIGDKHSNFFGNFKILPNKNFALDYHFAIDNNLTKSNYDSIKTDFSVNNFITSFEFVDDKKNITQKSYVANNTSFIVNDASTIGFNIRRNNDINATEFYDLYYSYSNDCLEAAITFNKSYYSDSDLKPEKQLFFSISIIPFGKVSTPNLNN